MGIMSGAMTVARFRVVGDLPGEWREQFRDGLNSYAFREPATAQGKEEVEGWVQVHNLLDTTFDDFNQWLYDDYAVFALRVDKKRLPAKLFRATLQKKIQEWCKERELERCPASVRSDLKDELEHTWLARTLPSVAVTEAAWCLSQRYLLLHSLSESKADRFRKRFLRTFGLRLIPWSPLDFLADREQVEQLSAHAPQVTLGASAVRLTDVEA
ncbi:MAG: recombination associated protein RdgC [Myxococcota bacterium]|jgi:recombination associated protein RdgC